ncbi:MULTISPECIES: VIT1/CCC1 transporter family protein [Actinotignum]|uniref:VIT1/CCC1 transporter family protein n=1 Tax=Actinotignum timonense TaxID=1870995 RepID=A0AAW9HPI9_9ACTO|nr:MULTISPECIES: VIT1/CCC1 transporter family protein [Actinotignum]MDE1558973.1 VIT1/CCC1 transporter family protein [Actinotignum schaalii]MDE1663969.1 VIT1/CCC1 transporter family protein [Actinotignum schaalii]MDK6373319.1 VIT1/CCC1 transporter family protein [Actinotignum timonense]MDK6419815.1 VIT1/CCC1 transporter family protein [Actinotignum timonense]MDK6645888.1 VIT1/CCC1 transporter family protein [Actinotignum timonense]
MKHSDTCRADASDTAPGIPGVLGAEAMNRLRAGVLGANDGIVSVAAVVIAMGGARASSTAILLAGLAALIGGAVSMALGEYISVSSQRDAELDALRRRVDVARRADVVCRSAGVSEPAIENNIVSPFGAAFSSFFSFLAGGAVPFAASLLAPLGAIAPICFVVTVAALALTGWIAAWIGQVPPLRPTIRTAVGGTLGLALTFGIGALFGQVV